ncbi:hypothetical protein GGR56DRAFT_641267 [Xylariaceae sp. FL0804]|nr:hypothetical protein GGR56DRAFT_641267 [Xylariaceae sp. FL0804]
MMLEPWDEVLTLQRERQRCAEDVKTIKASCAREHGKKHVMECAECWARLINRMRDRYLNSASKEWFSGRRAFLQDLDVMFSRAHQRGVTFKAIEQRIFEEKKEWYRDRIRNLGLHSAVGSPAEARALQQRLNDRSITTDQLASELRDTFSDGAVQNEEALNGFVERLKLARSPKARADAYIDIFFQPNHDPVGAAKCQKYIDMVANGIPIADALNAMLRDRQTAKGDHEQRQKLINKLEELKRAKAAHELGRVKKDQQREERARAAALSDDAPEMPLCSVCSREKPRNALVCPLCQVLAEHYKARDQATIYCSPECQEKDYDSHCEAMHMCPSGKECLMLKDEDEPMDSVDSTLVCCKECVEVLKMPSIFCSPSCFDTNFQAHRDGVHLPARRTTGREVNDEGQLEFDPDNKDRYRARRIQDHLVTFQDAMAEWQRNTKFVVGN